jgi:hypothetical protein
MKLNKELANAPAIKGFRAVEESRKWKEAVAEKTKGLSNEELLDYFRGQSPHIPRTPSRTQTAPQ